jgi:small-conductance mechanosensitive channel
MWWLVGVSGACFLATLIAVPWMVVRMPADYFTASRQSKAHDRHPALHLLITVLRNIVGYLFIILGVAMLILPGQGILTILAGLGLVDFPGKDRLIQRIVAQHTVRKSLDWIRQRAGRPPLVLDR